LGFDQGTGNDNGASGDDFFDSFGGSTDKPVAAQSSASWEKLSAFVPSQVTTRPYGEFATPWYRRYFRRLSVGPISPWHDIPLTLGGRAGPDTFLMVTEVPRGTREAQRMAVGEKLNPLKPEVVGGEILRFAEAATWNMGFLAQTWSDPAEVDSEFRLTGGGRPVGVIELGSREHLRGEVTRVRVLGAFPVVVDKSLHWNVVAVDMDDPLSQELKAMQDGALEEWAPVEEAIGRWFRDVVAKPGEVFDLLPQAGALRVIKAAHGAWNRVAA